VKPVRTIAAVVRRLTRRQQALLAGALAVLIAGLATWLLWPDGPDGRAPRERQYRSTTACLLTDDKGLAADPAKAAWAGMQEASVATLIKVQYLAITGPQTAANGLSYFNTLGVQRCTVIIAAGDVPVAAMSLGYQRFPNVQHVAIGGDPKGAPITRVDPGTPATIQSTVKDVVAKAA
jgi:hypothetical protein